MSDRVRPELYLADFTKGILCGIVEIAKRKPRGFLEGWRLYGNRSDAAAVAAYEMIKARHEYDLQFFMILHQIHRDSPVWRDAIRSELYTYRTLREWVPDGGFEILAGSNDLDYWLSGGAIAGTRELWIAAAEKFIEAYECYRE